MAVATQLQVQFFNHIQIDTYTQQYTYKRRRYIWKL